MARPLRSKPTFFASETIRHALSKPSKNTGGLLGRINAWQHATFGMFASFDNGPFPSWSSRYYLVDVMILGCNPILTALAMKIVARQCGAMAVQFCSKHDIWPYSITDHAEFQRMVELGFGLNAKQSNADENPFLPYKSDAKDWPERFFAAIKKDIDLREDCCCLMVHEDEKLVGAETNANNTGLHPYVFYLGGQNKISDPATGYQKQLADQFKIKIASKLSSPPLGSVRRGDYAIVAKHTILTSNWPGFGQFVDLVSNPDSRHFDYNQINTRPFGSARVQTINQKDSLRESLADVVGLQRLEFVV